MSDTFPPPREVDDRGSAAGTDVCAYEGGWRGRQRSGGLGGGSGLELEEEWRLLDAEGLEDGALGSSGLSPLLDQAVLALELAQMHLLDVAP